MTNHDDVLNAPATLDRAHLAALSEALTLSWHGYDEAAQDNNDAYAHECLSRHDDLLIHFAWLVATAPREQRT